MSSDSGAEAFYDAVAEIVFCRLEGLSSVSYADRQSRRTPTNLFAELVAHPHFGLIQHLSRSVHKYPGKRVLQLLLSASLQARYWVRYFVRGGYGGNPSCFKFGVTSPATKRRNRRKQRSGCFKLGHESIDQPYAVKKTSRKTSQNQKNSPGT